MNTAADHDPAALAALLVATAGRGASALVVGATARRRLALLAAARADLRGRTPRWLTAHLGTSVRLSARSLADEQGGADPVMAMPTAEQVLAAAGGPEA